MRKAFDWARGASSLVLLALAVAGLSAASPASADQPRRSRAAAMSLTAADTRRVHHRRAARRHVAARAGSLRTVVDANSASRSAPTPGAYVNATLYYDFEPGRLYTVNTSPRFLTAITLRPGEKLISKAAGDTVRWVLGETVEGTGPSQQVIVFVKPVRGSLRTNIILTTDQRTYLLDAVSHDGDTYTSVIAWNYPQEEMREEEAARTAEAEAATAATDIEHLNFGYSIKAVNTRHAPAWQPLRVFDDGLKTYIQFPPNLGSSEAPPLFLVGPKDQAELVNYRLLGGYYVVDRLIDVAELRLGENPQTVVRITRTGGTGPAGQRG
jgi:type IV secretion system protein VirB9